MRILADATAVGDGGGGICTFLLGLLSGWRAAGFDDDWRIIGMNNLPRAVDDLVAPPGSTHRGPNPSPVRRIWAQQVRLPVLARSRTWSPDVVLATTPVIPVVPMGVPVVAMVHDLRFLSFPGEFTPLTRGYRRLTYRYGLRRADGLLANSEFTRDEVQEVMGARGRPAEVIYLGADHVDRWATAGQTAGFGQGFAQGHGITFAHWSNKQPDVALRAWARLRDRQESFSCPLHVVGVRDVDAAGLTQLAAELDLSGLVRIHPFLPEAEYRELFASASIVLLPSTTEGFGLPVAEAQRLGIPVVANSVGGVFEVGGDAALYSTDGSPSSIAACCAEALFDPVRRAEMIRRGRQQGERFTWRATAERTRREFERCVAHG